MEYFNKNKGKEENTPTEIGLDDLLQEDKTNPELYAGFHDDIEKTEKSLENELQSLYDDIMKSGPATIVPKPISVIASEPAKAEDKPESPIEEAVEAPIEEIDEIVFEDISSVSEAPEPIKMSAQAVEEPKYEKPAEPVNTESSRDDIFNLIASLKSSAESETGFSDILSEIKENPEIKEAAPEEPARPAPQKTASERTDSLIPTFSIEDAFGNPAPVEEFPIEELAPIAAIGIEELPEDKPKKKAKEKDVKNKAEKKNDGPTPTSEIIRKVVLTVSIIVIVISLGILTNTYIIQPAIFKKNSKDISNEFDPTNTEVITEVGDSKYPSGMLAKYKQLYDINSDIAGWISIPSLEIDFPIAKGADNDYYLHRNIYKKYADYGVPFFDYRMTDLKMLHRNNVVYGHNMKNDDLIFGNLENYREVDFFKANPVIECNTIYGDHTWFICAVFLTNSTKSADNGYVFPYNFVDVDNVKFAQYITEIKKRSFYDTTVDIELTDKLLTLSTCCYDFNDARLVVVAREKRANESVNIDVSGATKNPNPKYPQAWYDAERKANPYTGDARW